MRRDDVRTDDDRLVYADHVGGERGELIVLQVSLARGGLSPQDAGARRRRVRTLIAEHPEWFRVPEDVLEPVHRGMRQTMVRKGFVDAIMATASAFLQHHAALFAAEPQLRLVTFLDTTPDELAALAACPGYRRLEGARFLQLEGDLDPALFTTAVRTDAFSHLRAVGMERVADPAWLTELDLSRVEYLSFRNLTRRTLLELVPRMPALNTLDIVGGTAPRNELIPALPPTLRELNAGTLDDAQLALLAHAKVAARLERLRVGIYAESRLLALFPRLRALEIAGLSRDTAARRFAQMKLPALRELWLHRPLRLRAIAEAHGNQLELLAVTPSAVDVRELVAGDVWTPPEHDLNRQIHIDVDHASSFDPPSLRAE